MLGARLDQGSAATHDALSTYLDGMATAWLSRGTRSPSRTLSRSRAFVAKEGAYAAERVRPQRRRQGTSGRGVNANRDRQCLIERLDFVWGQRRKKIPQGRLGDTDQFIAVDTALVLQPFRNPHGNLGRKAVIGGINRRANRRGEARVYQGLTTDHDEDARPLRIACRGFIDAIQRAASHSSS